jgi:hypothetical protein
MLLRPDVVCGKPGGLPDPDGECSLVLTATPMLPVPDCWSHQVEKTSFRPRPAPIVSGRNQRLLEKKGMLGK